MKSIDRVHKVIFSLALMLLPCILMAQANVPTEYISIKPGSQIVTNFDGDISMPINLIEESNPSLISAISSISGDKFRITFDALPNQSGEGIVIFSYYSDDEPSHPKTRKYVIEVAPSFVMAGSDFLTVNKNAAEQSVDVLINDTFDSSPDDTIYIKTVILTNSGSAYTDGNQLFYTPDLDYTGMSYVSYLVCDLSGQCDVGKLTVCVVDSNLAMESDEVNIYTTQGRSVELPLPGAGFSMIQSSTNGLTEYMSDDIFVYHPNPDFIGTEEIIFENSEGITRTFHVDVYENKERFHAMDDKFYTRPNTSVTFNVLANDLISYPIQSVSNASHGIILQNGGGELEYIPNNNFTGVEELTYTTCFEDTYCESATINIHVGNLFPDVTRTYKFKTIKNNALPIRYEIPLEDFEQSLSSVNGENGSLYYYDGYEANIPVACGGTAGYNVLLYTPDQDFVGTDYVEFYHANANNGLSALVKAHIEVVDTDVTCGCIEDCVWEGDANHDGIVNMEDLLTVGWELGSTGPARAPTGINSWYGGFSDAWSSDQPFTNENLKHIDSDGSGTIDHHDTMAIAAQYYQTHRLIPNDQKPKAEYAFSLIPVAFKIDSGFQVIIDIALGTDNNPVVDMHGVSFSLNIPAWMMDSSSMKLDFHPNSWLADHGSSMYMDAVPYDGRVDAGFTRANGNAVSGHGIVATLSFIVEDDVAGIRSEDGKVTFDLTLNDGNGYSATGQKLFIPGDTFEFEVDLNKPKDEPIDLEESLIIYPNPVSDVFNIKGNGVEIDDITIYNIQGQQVHYVNVQADQYSARLDHLTSGLYLMKIVTPVGTITKKVEKH